MLKKKSRRINRTVSSFPTLNIWLPPLLWEKSENHGNGHQKTNNFLCRLLTSCFCVWGPNGAVMISRAFAWQSSSQTLLVSPIQTGSSTIATVNCFSLLLRQSHTLSERLIKCVLFCFLFLQNHLWNLSAPFQKQEVWLRSDKDPLDFIQSTWASVIRSHYVFTALWFLIVPLFTHSEDKHGLCQLQFVVSSKVLATESTKLKLAKKTTTKKHIAFTFANCMTLTLGWMGFMVILYI